MVRRYIPKTGSVSKVGFGTPRLSKKTPHTYRKHREHRPDPHKLVAVPTKQEVEAKDDVEMTDFSGRKYHLLTKQAYPNEYKTHIEDATVRHQGTAYFVDIPEDQTVNHPVVGDVILSEVKKTGTFVSVRVVEVDARLDRSVSICWLDVI